MFHIVSSDQTEITRSEILVHLAQNREVMQVRMTSPTRGPVGRGLKRDHHLLTGIASQLLLGREMEPPGCYHAEPGIVRHGLRSDPNSEATDQGSR